MSVCAQCGTPMRVGSALKKYCSVRCQKRHSRGLPPTTLSIDELAAFIEDERMNQEYWAAGRRLINDAMEKNKARKARWDVQMGQKKD